MRKLFVGLFIALSQLIFAPRTPVGGDGGVELRIDLAAPVIVVVPHGVPGGTPGQAGGPLTPGAPRRRRGEGRAFDFAGDVVARRLFE